MIDEPHRWRPPIDFPTGVTHREALRRIVSASAATPARSTLVTSTGQRLSSLTARWSFPFATRRPSGDLRSGALE
jgi:hypothetical protein